MNDTSQAGGRTRVPRRTASPVLVVGTGLLGTSIALGLRRLGVHVLLDDASPSTARLAADLGAGELVASAHAEPGADAAADEAARPAPRLVVVAVPPDVTGEVVARALAAWPEATVTDVASVKTAPLAELRARGADLGRYVGSHPLAGRERGGPLSARADLFVGRPWAVCPTPETTAGRLQQVEGLILDLEATPAVLDAAAHDEAVALVSHVPQIVSSVVAEQLIGHDDAETALAGGGIRDLTRIAASDPALWIQILDANARPAARLLRSIIADLDEIASALEAPLAPGSSGAIARHLAAGNDGVALLPGKHGSRRAFASITVLVDDRPGQLARLLTEIGEEGINLEEISLEHSPGAPLGLAQIWVLPEARQRLVEVLSARDWRLAE